MKNNTYIYIIMASLLVLLVSFGAVSATDVTDNATVQSDTPASADTTEIDYANNDIIDNEINTGTAYESIDNSKLSTKRSTNEDSVDITPNNYDNIDTYMTQYSTLNFIGTFENKTLTITNGVTLTSNSQAQFENSHFIVNANGVTISNLNFENTDNNNGSVITVNAYNTANILNNNITVTKTTSGETIGIYLDQTTQSNIINNNILINAYPQNKEWINTSALNWYGYVQVAGVLVDNAELVNITNNNITVTNSTTTMEAVSTSNAIDIRNSSNKISVRQNKLDVSGANYVYGVTVEKSNNCNVTYNNMILNSENYVCGVDASESKNDNISYNNITGEAIKSENSSLIGESFAYGVYLSSNNLINLGNNNIEVSYNNINLNSDATYGVEGYKVKTNNIIYNNITVNGSFAMGMGFNGSSSNTIQNNKIIVTAYNRTMSYVSAEAVPPMTTGIKIIYTLLSGGTNNVIDSNHILVTENNPVVDDIYAVVSYYANTVTNNYLTSIYNTEDPKTGDDAVDKVSTLIYPVSNNSPYDLSESSSLSNNNKLLKSYKLQNKLGASSKTIVLNSLTFDTYVTDNQFNDLVNDGDTIDIQGVLDDPSFSLTINKPVNIISSTGDGFISCDCGDIIKRDWDGEITIASEGSGTNITGITIYNTQFYVKGASNIVLDNISVICDHKLGLGQGVGITSIREGSTNVTVKNSLFKTDKNGQNGGYSTFVCAGTSNILIENNSFVCSDDVGNIVYFTTYAGFETGEGQTGTNTNITFRNNYIDANNATEQAVCWALVLQGSNFTIENNVIEYTGRCLSQQYGSDPESISNVVLINNTIPYGSSVITFTNTTIINNTINNPSDISNTQAINNTFNSISITNCTFDSNTITDSLTASGTNIITNNQINTLYLSNSASSNIFNNTIQSTRDYAIYIDEDSVFDEIRKNNMSSTLYTANESIYDPTNEAFLENNTMINRLIIVNDDNFDQYFRVLEGEEVEMMSQQGLPATMKVLNITLNNKKVPLDNGYTTTILESADLYINTTKTDIIYYEIGYGGSVTLKLFDAPNISLISSLSEDSNFTYNKPVYPARSFNVRNSKFIIFDDEGVNFIKWSEQDLLPQYMPYVELGYMTEEELIAMLIEQYGSTSLSFAGPVNLENDYIIYIDKYGNIKFGEDVLENITTERDMYGNENTVTSSNLTPVIDAENRYVIIDGYNFTIDPETNKLNSTVTTPATIFVYKTYNKDIIIDKPINLTTLYGMDGVINSTITFVEGSEGSNITNLTFGTNGRIIIENTTNINIENNVFNTTLTPITVTNSTAVNIKNNEITTTADNTIVFDETSTNNSVTYNYLVAKSTYAEDSIESTSNTIENNTPVIPTNVTITLSSSSVVGIKPVNATITINKDDGAIETGSINIYLNGRPYETLNFTNGTATTTITSENLGRNYIKAEYLGEKNYDFSMDKEAFTVNIYNTTTTIDRITAYYLDNITLTATVTSKDTVNEGVVYFKVGEETITDDEGNIIYVPVENGTATTTITANGDLPEKAYIYAIYNGTSGHLTSEGKNLLALNQLSTTTTATPITGIVGDTITITTNITSENDETINDGVVYYKVNETELMDKEGNIIYTNVENGTTTLEYTLPSNWANKELTITTIYNGTSRYIASENENTITVKQLNTTTTVTPITGIVGDTITITTNITSENDETINDGKVFFKVNGATLKDDEGNVIYANVQNGIATVEYTLTSTWAKDNMTLTAIYVGTSRYISSRSNTTIDVNKRTATVTVINEPEYKIGSTINIMALITDNDKIIKTGTVIFKLNGITLKDKNGKTITATVNNGVAQIQYTLSSVRNYTITAVYSDKNYDRAEGNNTFTVLKGNIHLETEPIIITNNTPAVLTGKIIDSQGQLVSRPFKVTIKINGVTFANKVTVNNGTIKITLNESITGTTSIDNLKMNKLYDILVIAGENTQYYGLNQTTILVKQ